MATTDSSIANSASSTTKPNNRGGLTTVPVTLKRRVTYYFQCTTAANVSIPYAVSVNGKVLDAFANTTRRVASGKTVKNKKEVFTRGEFSVMVEPGAKVALYLNSDAPPQRRSTPVYAVTAGDRDVEVHITEKEGKHVDTDAPVLTGSGVPATGADPGDANAAKVDRYMAPLTGDIWMKVSYKYTAGDVDALMPEGTSAAVIAAIKSIYDGLGSATLHITEPATDAAPARTLKIDFSDSSNPIKNISTYSLLKDGLTRVHPAGYAALFTSAIDNGVTSLSLSSCWRPMLGSIAHRAGLGLDVSVVGKTTMNRQELRRAFEGSDPRKKGNGVDTDNVSEAEVAAFGEYEDAIKANKKAKADLGAAQKALEAAKKTNDAGKIAVAQEMRKAAGVAADAAAALEVSTGKKWSDERDTNEPSSVRTFRASLLKCSCVRQLFDPWVMDENTQDKTEPSPNMQRGADTSNERLHAHHLHITVHDPKIL